MRRVALLALLLGAPALAQEADPHAGHSMPAQGEEKPAQPDPHAGHTMPAAPDPHAGHVMPAADPHAGHDMAAMQQSDDAADPPVAPPPPAALMGPAYAADAIFGADAMAAARRQLQREHGDIRAARLLIERAEARLHDGRNGYALEAEAWSGGDIDRALLRTRLHADFKGDAEAAIEGAWRHALNPWFNLLLGVRQDVGPGPDRTHAMIAIAGLAPYWFEVEGAAYLSTKGELTARFEAELDQRLTQKLIIQPAMEFELSAQDMPELALGSGLTSAEVGVRLRYEFIPEFAPYIGVAHERKFGGTADYAKARSEETAGWRLLLGLRTWF